MMKNGREIIESQPAQLNHRFFLINVNKHQLIIIKRHFKTFSNLNCVTMETVTIAKTWKGLKHEKSKREIKIYGKIFMWEISQLVWIKFICMLNHHLIPENAEKSVLNVLAGVTFIQKINIPIKYEVKRFSWIKMPLSVLKRALVICEWRKERKFSPSIFSKSTQFFISISFQSFSLSVLHNTIYPRFG